MWNDYVVSSGRNISTLKSLCFITLKEQFTKTLFDLPKLLIFQIMF